MHEPAATRGKCGRQTVARHETTFQALNVGASFGEPALSANDEALRHSATTQLSNQQLRLPLTTAVTAGEIDVADWL